MWGAAIWTYVPKSSARLGAPRAGRRDSAQSFTMRKTVRKAMPNPVRNPLWIDLVKLALRPVAEGVHGKNLVNNQISTQCGRERVLRDSNPCAL